MRALMIVLMLLMLMAAGTAQAMTPTETVRNQVAQALRTFSQQPGGTPAAAERRRSEIRQAADGLFDFTEMSRRALGRHWAGRSPADREDFIKLFADLMARAYLGKIDRYAGESITYVGERVDGDLAERSEERVITPKKSEVPIEYRLRPVGGLRRPDREREPGQHLPQPVRSHHPDQLLRRALEADAPEGAGVARGHFLPLADRERRKRFMRARPLAAMAARKAAAGHNSPCL